MAPRSKNASAKNAGFKSSPQGLKKRLGKVTAKKVGDARQRIIQKKRKTVVDARDILSGMAKGQDARSKLVKMRVKGKPVESNVKAIGKNILRKTDRNGRISLVTTKNRPAHNMNAHIQQQLGLSPYKTAHKPARVAPVKRHKEYPPAVIRKTIRNDYSAPIHPQYPLYEPDMYRWYPGMAAMIPPMEVRRRPSMDITVSRGLVSDSTSGDWKTFSSKVRQPTGYIDLDAADDDEEMPMMSSARPGMSRVSSNIHSRLDSKPASNSHGIMSQSKTKVVVPMGHRIVVSNLQATVTQDDIRELFEDIGQLLVAQLVRPGTAEVIYKNLKDAQKAVDTYHNRQLDGQPMKCLLVNKRPVNNPTAPAIKPSAESLLSRKMPSSSSSSSNKLVPDLSTIHKVLFQRN